MANWGAALVRKTRTRASDPSPSPEALSKRARAAAPSRTSPTQRSLRYLRSKGFLCAIVEHWNHFAGIRQDLFGIIDIVALKWSSLPGIVGQTLGVQTTSGSNVSSRVAKIKASPYYATLKACGWKIVVHGWAKKGARGKPKLMTLREEVL